MPRKSSTRTKIIILLSFGLVLCACAGFLLPLDLAGNLALGWLFFLARVIPSMKVDASGVATALLCAALLAVGIHVFSRWFVVHFNEGVASPPAWRSRWTGMIIAAVVVLFVSGIATVGMTHQVGWLLTSKDPWVSSTGGSRIVARRVQSLNNLKEIGVALHEYHNDQGAFPLGGTFDPMGQPLHGWQAMILDKLDNQELFHEMNFQIPWTDARNASVFRTTLGIYINPGIVPRVDRDDRGYALSHYAGNVRVLGGDHSLRIEDIKDGTAQTLFAGEVATGFKPWGDPVNWRDPALGVNRSPNGFGGPWVGGASFLLVDGSVRFIKNSVDPRIMKALSTPASGERISSESY